MANPPGATSAISATGAAGAAVRDLLEPEPAAQESGSEGPKESKEEPKEKAREAKKTRPVERPGFRWPQVPDRPPAAYARYFGKTWPREGLALALIASGISMRLEAAELVGRRFDVNGRAGSVRRMFERMAKRGLFDSEVVNVGTASAMLLWLTGLGREVCKAVKFPVRETDYERMLRLHGGQRQKEHAGAVVVFAYHARKRGFQVQVLPEVERPAEPDVLVARDGEAIYVEVELGRGKQPKWKNIFDLQTHVAICALNSDARAALVREVKALGFSGRATDLQALIKGTDGGDLWVEEWE